MHTLRVTFRIGNVVKNLNFNSNSKFVRVRLDYESQLLSLGESDNWDKSFNQSWNKRLILTIYQENINQLN